MPLSMPPEMPIPAADPDEAATPPEAAAAPPVAAVPGGRDRRPVAAPEAFAPAAAIAAAAPPFTKAPGATGSRIASAARCLRTSSRYHRQASQPSEVAADHAAPQEPPRNTANWRWISSQETSRAARLLIRELRAWNTRDFTFSRSQP